MRQTRGVRTRRAVLGLVVLVATACSGAPGDEAGSGPAPEPSPGHTTITLLPETVAPGLGISFVQQRTDEGTPRADVRVSNGTDRPLRVRAVGLDWAAFPGDVQRVSYAVPPQTVIDLPYRLPRADCSARAAEAPMRGVVVTAQRRIVRPMPADGRRFLDRLHSSACVAREIAASVRVAWDVSGDPAELESGTWLDAVRRGGLLLTRTGRSDARPITVAQVQGSVLFELAVPRSARLAAHERRARVPVRMSPGRCDEHARSQSSQTFVWRVWLRVGRGPLLPLVLEPRRRDHAALLAWLDRACAGHTGH